mgnify:FL=1
MEIAPSASPVMIVRLLSLHVFTHGGLHPPCSDACVQDSYNL